MRPAGRVVCASGESRDDTDHHDGRCRKAGSPGRLAPAPQSAARAKGIADKVPDRRLGRYGKLKLRANRCLVHSRLPH
jgi:hypothetical protein